MRRSSRSRTRSRGRRWRSRRSRSSTARRPARPRSPSWSRASCRSIPRYRQKAGRCRSTSGRRCGSTTPTSTSRTTSAAGRAAGTGRGRGAGRDLMARVMSAAARPRPPAVGVLGHRRAGRRPVGDDLQGPPLHGRRRLGHRLYQVVLDPTPQPRAPAARRLAAGAGPAGPSRWPRRALGTSCWSRGSQARALGRAAAPRHRDPRAGRDVARGAAGARGEHAPAHRSSLSGPRGRARRYAVAHGGRRRRGGPQGVRRHHQRRRARGGHRRLPRAAAGPRGELHPTPVRTLVPVSVRVGRRGGSPGQPGVAACCAMLPVHIADPVAAAGSWYARGWLHLKAAKEAEAGAALVSLAALQPPLLAGALRGTGRLPARRSAGSSRSRPTCLARARRSTRSGRPLLRDPAVRADRQHGAPRRLDHDLLRCVDVRRHRRRRRRGRRRGAGTRRSPTPSPSSRRWPTRPLRRGMGRPTMPGPPRADDGPLGRTGPRRGGAW